MAPGPLQQLGTCSPSIAPQFGACPNNNLFSAFKPSSQIAPEIAPTPTQNVPKLKDVQKEYVKKSEVVKDTYQESEIPRQNSSSNDSSCIDPPPISKDYKPKNKLQSLIGIKEFLSLNKLLFTSFSSFTGSKKL